MTGITDNIEPSANAVLQNYAELRVIATLMRDNEFWIDIAARLTEDHFNNPSNKIIFSVALALRTEEKSAALGALQNALAQRKQLEAAGGAAHLAEIYASTPGDTEALEYIDILDRHKLLSRLKSDVKHIALLLTNSTGLTEELETILDAMQSSAFAASENFDDHSHPRHIAEILPDCIDTIDDAFTNGVVPGLKTGLKDVDQMLEPGPQAGDLVVLGARPSMGKTSWAMNIAEHASKQVTSDDPADNLPVVVFSMEMPSEQLGFRLLSSAGRVPLNIIRTGQLSDADWPRLTHATGELQSSNLIIDDTPALSVFQIAAKARKISLQNGGIKLIVIDYLQLMSGSGRAENRNLEVNEITRRLKELARTMGCPILLLSQLNRNLESRANKRPGLADLRESGGIEQDADIVAFIYRDEVYNDDSPDKGTAETIIAKHRNGAIGVVSLAFLGEYCRFEDIASEHITGDPGNHSLSSLVQANGMSTH